MRSKPAFGHQFLSRGLSVKPCCLRNSFYNSVLAILDQSNKRAPSRVCQWPHQPPTPAHGLSAAGTCAILTDFCVWKYLNFQVDVNDPNFAWQNYAPTKGPQLQIQMQSQSPEAGLWDYLGRFIASQASAPSSVSSTCTIRENDFFHGRHMVCGRKNRNCTNMSESPSILESSLRAVAVAASP